MAEQDTKNQKDYECEIDWTPITEMSELQVREELGDQRHTYEQMEKDAFKKQTQIRKLEQQVKQLQELTQAQKVNTNNTSSAFTLPSEFKKLWDELVSDLMMDSFPDFLDDYQLFVGFVQQLFIQVREDLLLQTKRDMVKKVADAMNLGGGENELQVLTGLEKKLQGIFQDNSARIFDFSEERLKQFTEEKFKPRCLALLKSNEAFAEKEEMFLENIDSPDFIRFMRAVIVLQQHMVLNEPPIEMSLQTVEQRINKGEDEQSFLGCFEFWLYNKTDYYCIDGFNGEGNPCVVVLPPPYRQGYVYQGIKPAVLVFSEREYDNDSVPVDFESLCTHVRKKQEDVLEKIKAKRASSLVPLECERKQAAEESADEGKNETINITQIKLDFESPERGKEQSEEKKTPRQSMIVDDGTPISQIDDGDFTTAGQQEQPLESEVTESSCKLNLEALEASSPSKLVKNTPKKQNIRSASGGNLLEVVGTIEKDTTHQSAKDLSEEVDPFELEPEKKEEELATNESVVKLSQSQNRLATQNHLGSQLTAKVMESERRSSQYKREKTNSRSSSSQKREAVTGLNMLTASISTSSQASIIAEMHFQRGMNDIRQDLQRKIYSYQSILKKTHAAAEKRKADKMGALEASICHDSPPDSQNISNFTAGVQSKKNQEATRPGPKFFNEPQNKAGANPIGRRKNSGQQAETGCKPTSQSKLVQKPGNKDTLQHLKTAYFSKMQSLNAKLENDRAMHRKQLERSRHRNGSRSKSPLQQGRNLPRQIPQTKVLASGKMTGVSLAQKNITKVSKSSKERLQQNYAPTRKPLKTATTTAQAKRKYVQQMAPSSRSNNNNLRSDDAPTASSNSSMSSNFDDTDTEDADEVLMNRKEPTSLEDLAYEPISKLGQRTPNAMEDSISSGSDDDDDLIRRPGITQTFYQPDYKRIENNRRGYGAPLDSARLAEGIYQPPKQLQTYHNSGNAPNPQDLRSLTSYQNSQSSVAKNHHPLRYSPSTVKATTTLATSSQYPSMKNAVVPSHSKLLSPKQMQQVARRTREAYSKHQKRVSSGSRQPNSSNDVRGGGGGSSHQVVKTQPQVVIGQNLRQSAKQVNKFSRDHDRDNSLRQTRAEYPAQSATQAQMVRSNSSRFYQPQAAYQQLTHHHAHIRTTQPFHHQVNNSITVPKSDHASALQTSHSSKGILVNNFF